MKKLLLIFIAVSIAGYCSAQEVLDKDWAAEVAKSCGLKDQRLLVERLRQVNDDIAEKGIVNYVPDDRRLLTGYAYHEMYDWDLYFENIYLSYFGVNDYCFSNLKSFMEIQCINGFIPRTLIEKRERQHFKPFFAQTAELGSRQSGNYTWLAERADQGQWQKGPALRDVSYYEQIKLSVDYWFRHCDFDLNGLPVWNSSDHSGMDNQISRAGELDAFRYEGVDLACYLYRELKALEVLSAKLGMSEESESMAVRASLLADKINTVFWDEQDGFYYDRDEYTGRLVRVKTVAGFIPMWAGIAPPRRVERLVREHLLNPEEFWIEYPVATYARSEPDYAQGDIRDWGCNWRGSAWIPTNYMIMHGLMNYGYDDIARELAQRTFDMVLKVNPVTYEFYNGETGQGLGLKQFWGWSALGYMMPFECAAGYDPGAVGGGTILPVGKTLFGIDFPAVGDNIRKIDTKLSLEEIRY